MLNSANTQEEPPISDKNQVEKIIRQKATESLEQDHKPSTKDGAGNYR